MSQVLPEYLSEWTTKRAAMEGVICTPNTEVVDYEIKNGQLNLVLTGGKIVSVKWEMKLVLLDIFDKSQYWYGTIKIISRCSKATSRPDNRGCWSRSEYGPRWCFTIGSRPGGWWISRKRRARGSQQSLDRRRRRVLLRRKTRQEKSRASRSRSNFRKTRRRKYDRRR